MPTVVPLGNIPLMSQIKIHQSLRELRQRERLTQEKMAARHQVNLSTWKQWETGGSKPPPEKVLELAEHYGLSLDQIYRADFSEPEKSQPAAHDGTPLELTAEEAGVVVQFRDLHPEWKEEVKRTLQAGWLASRIGK